MSQQFDGAVEALDRYMTDPMLQIKEVQGINSVKKYQLDKVIMPIMLNERSATAACHAVGKTFSFGTAVRYFLPTFPGTRILTTAPSLYQVKNLLWKEIRNGYRRARMPLGGRMLDLEWNIEEKWSAFGLSPDDGAEGDGSQGTSSGFQGFHIDKDQYPLAKKIILFEEATGIGPKRWVQADGLMTQADCHWSAIGNPTSPNCNFAQCFKDPLWSKYYISCYDTPNLIVNNITSVEDVKLELEKMRHMSDNEVIRYLRSYKVATPYLVTASWVMGLALRKGVTHPLFVSKAEGRFPDQDDYVLIPLSEVDAAQNRTVETTDHDPWFIGLDPARMGKNDSVFTVLEGYKQRQKVSLSKHDAVEVLGQLIAITKDLKVKRDGYILIDSTGLGGPIYDFALQAQRDGHIPAYFQIIALNFGEKPDPEPNAPDQKQTAYKRYKNKKAWMYDELSEDIKKLELLPETVYQEELPGVRYSYDKEGKMVIESKEEYQVRTGLESPDSGDSLALANFGRHVMDKVGSFSEAMKKHTQRRGTIVGGRNSGDSW